MRSKTIGFPTVSLLLLLGAGLCHSQIITPAGVTVTSSPDATLDDTTDLGGGFHQVNVAIPRALAPGGKLFARLKVTVTP